jgi:C1A family cysteine protease
MTDGRGPEPLAQLRATLAEQGDPWLAGETTVSRMSEERRLALLGVPLPTEEEIAARDGQAETMAAAARGTAGMVVALADAPSASLPVSFDLRNVGGRNYITPVKDQRGCGSCVAFGIVASMESTAEYTRGAPGLDLDLSEAHLYHVHAKARGYTCASGSWPDDLFTDAANTGVTFEDYFPYNDAGTVNLNADWPNRLAKAQGVTDLTANPGAMKQHIYARGAINACFIVYTDFFNYRSGVYKHTTDDVAGGHCVALIGWDDAQGCWIGKNSWGVGWGDSGYFRIAYGDSFIEDYPGSRPTVYGCTGVSLRAWLTARRALQLYATANDANGWVYLENYGWTYLSGGARTTTNKLAELAHARASGRPVTPFVDAGHLQTVMAHD